MNLYDTLTSVFNGLAHPTSEFHIITSLYENRLRVIKVVFHTFILTYFCLKIK